MSTTAELWSWQRAAWRWWRTRLAGSVVLMALGAVIGAWLAHASGQGYEARYRIVFVRGAFGIGLPEVVALASPPEPGPWLPNLRETFKVEVQEVAHDVESKKAMLGDLGAADIRLVAVGGGDYGEIRVTAPDPKAVTAVAPVAAQRLRAAVVDRLRLRTTAASTAVDSRLAELAPTAGPDGQTARAALIVARERLRLASAGLDGQVSLDRSRATPAPVGLPAAWAASAGAIVGVLVWWLVALTLTHRDVRPEAP